MRHFAFAFCLRAAQAEKLTAQEDKVLPSAHLLFFCFVFAEGGNLLGSICCSWQLEIHSIKNSVFCLRTCLFISTAGTQAKTMISAF